jgi:predicted acyl esterase
MYSVEWRTSRREFGVIREGDVAIPTSAGIKLDCDIFRPDAPGKFPVILGLHAYSKADQTAPLMPIGTGGIRGHMEAGDFNFYVRRGYVHVIANVRGSGKSEGLFECFGPGEIQDIHDAIEWLASRPWCDGNVGMFGPSYFAIVQKRVAALNPPHLKALFAMYGFTDIYRDFDYHGGILRYNFRQRWIHKIDNMRIKNRLKEQLGEKEYSARIEKALQDPEIAAVSSLVELLRDPDRGRNSLIVEPVLNPLDGQHHRQYSLSPDAELKIPAYLGSCWGVYGLHLPGDCRSWEQWKGPKKFTVGPPIYLDRPLYQYHYESLRWFDYWLKGIDTKIMEEPPVQVFIDGTGDWKEASDWPLPETRWTPFYLHENGLLSEHEFWPNESPSTFTDSPYSRGSVTFRTPPMVESTEICGPMVLNLYASTTDTDVLWFVSLLEISPNGEERLLTRGWLRGSQRRIDPELSRPWQPYHLHTGREPLTPNEIYEFNIEVRPYGILLRPGYRIMVRIKCCDDEVPPHHLHGIGMGHLWRQNSARVTVYHDADHPSHMLLPITRGNRIGTYISGGIITS